MHLALPDAIHSHRWTLRLVTGLAPLPFKLPFVYRLSLATLASHTVTAAEDVLAIR